MNTLGPEQTPPAIEQGNKMVLTFAHNGRVVLMKEEQTEPGSRELKMHLSTRIRLIKRVGYEDQILQPTSAARARRRQLMEERKAEFDAKKGVIGKQAGPAPPRVQAWVQDAKRKLHKERQEREQEVQKQAALIEASRCENRSKHLPTAVARLVSQHTASTSAKQTQKHQPVRPEENVVAPVRARPPPVRPAENVVAPVRRARPPRPKACSQAPQAPPQGTPPRQATIQVQADLVSDLDLSYPPRSNKASPQGDGEEGVQDPELMFDALLQRVLKPKQAAGPQPNAAPGDRAPLTQTSVRVAVAKKVQAKKVIVPQKKKVIVPIRGLPAEQTGPARNNCTMAKGKVGRPTLLERAIASKYEQNKENIRPGQKANSKSLGGRSSATRQQQLQLPIEKFGPVIPTGSRLSRLGAASSKKGVRLHNVSVQNVSRKRQHSPKQKQPSLVQQKQQQPSPVQHQQQQQQPARLAIAKQQPAQQMAMARPSLQSPPPQRPVPQKAKAAEQQLNMIYKVQQTPSPVSQQQHLNVLQEAALPSRPLGSYALAGLRRPAENMPAPIRLFR
eukprot:g60768.t1